MVIAMFNCSGTRDVLNGKRTEPEVCEESKTYWQPRFEGAAGVTFLPIDASTIESLTETLRKD